MHIYITLYTSFANEICESVLLYIKSNHISFTSFHQVGQATSFGEAAWALGRSNLFNTSGAWKRVQAWQHECSALIKHSKTLTVVTGIVNESNDRTCDNTWCVIPICPWLLDILVSMEPSGAIWSEALGVSEHFFKIIRSWPLSSQEMAGYHCIYNPWSVWLMHVMNLHLHLVQTKSVGILCLSILRPTTKHSANLWLITSPCFVASMQR